MSSFPKAPSSLYLFYAREPPKGSHSGPNTLPSDCSGLCGTVEVPEETKNWRKGIHPTINYACSFTCAVYLHLVPNLETTEFIRSLKCYIPRRGRPQRIYSDNGKTFVSASKWIEQVKKDERIYGFLAQQGIEWKFNLSRAPWWGRQFERLIGMVKGSLYKSIGNGLLSWNELQEVLLDVEVALNNRRMTLSCPSLPQVLYCTCNRMHCQNWSQTTSKTMTSASVQSTWAGVKMQCRCWTKEYLRGLWERHCLKHKGNNTHLAVGDVVIIKSDEKNRAQWKLGVVIDLILGRDGVARGAKLRTPKSVIECPVQHLYPIELTSDMTMAPAALNPTVPAFRPRRNAAVAARACIQELAQMHDQD